jgi:hypothetical protein
MCIKRAPTCDDVIFSQRYTQADLLVSPEPKKQAMNSNIGDKLALPVAQVRYGRLRAAKVNKHCEDDASALRRDSLKNVKQDKDALSLEEIPLNQLTAHNSTTERASANHTSASIPHLTQSMAAKNISLWPTLRARTSGLQAIHGIRADTPL